jgi:hypothetical protein
MREICLKCGSSVGIREIIYGPPDGPEDDVKTVLGGCCITDQDPTSTCTQCGWEGDYEDLARIFGK